MYTLITCNLRCDVPADGINYFFNRKDFLLERLLREKPDIIGFQEMTPRMREALVHDLSEYALVGSARGSDLSGECNNIAYRRDRFQLHMTDTSWLSPTPKVPGSRYEGQSSCPRVVTAACLYDPEHSTRFYVYNTHLDHVSAHARMEGLSLVFKRAERDASVLPLPAFIMGDFNFTPGNEEYGLIERSDAFCDVTAHTGGTYHGFGQVPAEKIDYILANAEASRGIFDVTRIHECQNGVYLSDHDPVAVRWTPAP